jgi:hypothetical protein
MKALPETNEPPYAMALAPSASQGLRSFLDGAASHEHRGASGEGQSALHEVRPASHFDMSRLSFDDAATVHTRSVNDGEQPSLHEHVGAMVVVVGANHRAGSP